MRIQRWSLNNISNETSYRLNRFELKPDSQLNKKYVKKY